MKEPRWKNINLDVEPFKLENWFSWLEETGKISTDLHKAMLDGWI